MGSIRNQLIRWAWSKDEGQYPQCSPVPYNWFGVWLRIKCTICILLWRTGDPFDWKRTHVPVAIGPLVTSWSPDGPSADWTELAVGLEWNHWQFYEYRNGI